MTVSRERTYGEKILHRAWDTLQPAMRAAHKSAERRAGEKLKITDVRLIPVAGEQREVYDVMLTMVPDRAIPSEAAAPQPPEANNAGI